MKIVNKKNDIIIRFGINKVIYNIKLDSGINDLSNYPNQVKKFLKDYLCNIEEDRYVIYIDNVYDSSLFSCSKGLSKEECKCIKNNLIVLTENDLSKNELLSNKVSTKPDDVKMKEFNKNYIKILYQELDMLERFRMNISVPENIIEDEDENNIQNAREAKSLFYNFIEERKRFIREKITELESLDKESEDENKKQTRKKVTKKPEDDLDVRSQNEESNEIIKEKNNIDDK